MSGTDGRTRRASVLIAQVMERFHERHRAQLPDIVALANRVEAAGAPAGIAARLEGMAEALEAHMFKEEMRLFPMMEQGGSGLIGQLIDDMAAEHESHRAAIEEVRSAMGQVEVAAEAAADLAALREALAVLFSDLAEHMRVEDEELFALFPERPPVRML